MAQRMQFQHSEVSAMPQADEGAEADGDVAVAAAPVRTEPKIGRNEPCPCGSGKKYKHCHGQLS
ncbi:preprotein translocase subunit SecA [compost metagenome]